MSKSNEIDSQKQSDNMELIMLQLKLIINEIQLLKYSLPSNDTYSAKPVNFENNKVVKVPGLNYIEIKCRRCHKLAEIMSSTLNSNNKICYKCQTELIEEFESDDEEIDIK